MLQEFARITYCSFLYCQVSQSPNIGVLRRKIELHWTTVTKLLRTPRQIQRKLLRENKEKEKSYNVSLSALGLLQPNDGAI